MNNRQATYNGIRMNVLQEDDKTVTLEQWGMKVRVARESVMFDKAPEDILVKEKEDFDILNPQEDILVKPEDVKHNDILPLDEKAVKDTDLIQQELQKLKDNGVTIDGLKDEHIGKILKFSAPHLFKFFAGMSDEKPVDVAAAPVVAETSAPITEVAEIKKSFKDQYGKKGEAIYYATANKQHRNPETFKKLEEDHLNSHMKDFSDIQNIVSYVFEVDKNKAKDALMGMEEIINPNLKENMMSRYMVDYPKAGVDVSTETSDDRHHENEKRRKEALSNFRAGLQKMLEDIDALENDDCGEDCPGCEKCEDMIDDSDVGMDKVEVAIDENMKNDIEVTPFPVSDDADLIAQTFLDDLKAEQDFNNDLPIERYQEVMKIAKDINPDTLTPDGRNLKMETIKELEAHQNFELKKSKIEEDGEAGGTTTVPANITGPGTTTANVVGFAAKLGADPKKKKTFKESLEETK